MRTRRESSRRRTNNATEHADDEALAPLHTAYAEGRLSHEEFEGRLERLFETETLHDAAEWTDREATDRREPATDRDRY